ncbi:MAG: hypothetical protein ACI395_06755 [Candidatus Cryptobacteroides sp.]
MSSPMPMVTLVKTLDVTRLVRICRRRGQPFNMMMCWCIGTSAIVQTELDCIVNQYASEFNNPMVLWGKYRKGLFRTRLPVSFQFHHIQMDGSHGALFLENLQKTINSL